MLAEDKQGLWRSNGSARRLCAFLKCYRDSSRIDQVNVDAIGIGYNFGLHLDDQGFPVNLVNVGEAAADSKRFSNLKAEYYWGLRERFAAGEISGLTDETTISQFAAIRYKQTPAGKIQIESKEDARKRGVKSPDRAEAIMLAFADRTPGIIDFYRDMLARRNEPEGIQTKGIHLWDLRPDGRYIDTGLD